MRCGDCRFFDDRVPRESLGLCRESGPRELPGEAGQRRTGWPWVNGTGDWCGRFEERPIGRCCDCRYWEPPGASTSATGRCARIPGCVPLPGADGCDLFDPDLRGNCRDCALWIPPEVNGHVGTCCPDWGASPVGMVEGEGCDHFRPREESSP